LFEFDAVNPKKNIVGSLGFKNTWIYDNMTIQTRNHAQKDFHFNPVLRCNDDHAVHHQLVGFDHIFA
jgi:hypothetical protein